MKLENVFLAFLYSDKSEHLIYKKGDKFIDLINNNEINYLDIDLNSIRKYRNNKILYDDWNMKDIKRRVEENIDIDFPILPNRRSIIKKYQKYRNQLIDTNKYSIMLLYHDIYDYYDNGKLHYLKQVDSIATYLKLFDNQYYDIFTGAVYKAQNYHGYKLEPYLQSYDKKMEDLIGNKVLRKDLYNYAYRIMANDRERRSKK